MHPYTKIEFVQNDLNVSLNAILTRTDAGIERSR